jgi:Staphylococcal nuclease homologue
VFKGGTNVNLVLVQRGAASVWFYQGERGRFAAKLKRAADTARAKKRGAWGTCKASTNYEAAWTTAPKPKPKPAQSQPPSNCHPSYTGACLDPSVSDYDCAGGSGNGPAYTGQVRVVGHDEYGLDADGDGIGCE